MSDVSYPALDLSAITALIPTPEASVPLTESTSGSAGNNANKFSMAGHSHPRLTSTTLTTLAADGTATVNFTRTFINKPGVVMTEVEPIASQPLVLVVISYIQTGGVYTGAVIKGYRSQALPSQNQLSVASLLTGVITGVNSLASSLTGFNVFGGTTTGAQVSVVAIARSDVA